VRNGVNIGLLVDVEDQSVMVFRPNEALTPLQSSDRISLPEILPEFDLTVDQLFASLR